MLLLCIADMYSILRISSTSWTSFIVGAILCFHIKLISLLAAVSMWFINLWSALVFPPRGLPSTYTQGSSGMFRKSTLLKSADMLS
ncbi:hypothetical protein XELAEV_18006152mg, partial [Xenopus laevis]